MTKEEFQPQSDPTEPPPERDDLQRGYQVEFISNATVIAWATTILGLLVVAAGVSFALWGWLDAQSPKSDLLLTDEPTPLDPHQRQSRLKFESEQQARLDSYGWVEPERNIVRIPIERAMDLLIERTNP